MTQTQDPKLKKQYPRVGVGVAIVHNNKILLGKRKKPPGAGCWAFPGGHLEFNETLEQCAKRETWEETGLQVEHIKPIFFTNDIFTKEDKHYVTILVRAESSSDDVELKEPLKCEQWQWFAWNDFPFPLFLSLNNAIEQGFTPFLTSYAS